LAKWKLGQYVDSQYDLVKHELNSKGGAANIGYQEIKEEEE